MAERMGFQLALVLVLIGLAAPVAAQEGARSTDREKREETLRTMRGLMDGLFGRGSGLGYLGDMGRVPSNLQDLAASSANPAYSTAHAGEVGMGYAGPYMPRAAGAASSVVDGWGTPLSLVTTASTVQVRSGGPDRDLTTTEDNISYPVNPRTSHGAVEVRVYSVPAAGGAGTLLGQSDVDVVVYYSNAGAQSSRTATDGGSKVFQASGLHVGRHYVVATAKVAADYDVASAAEVTTLRSSKVKVQLRLVAKAKEEAAPETKEETPAETADKKKKAKEEKSTTICHQPTKKSAKTMVITESALAAHLKHGDTLGACP